MKGISCDDKENTTIRSKNGMSKTSNIDTKFMGEEKKGKFPRKVALAKIKYLFKFGE